MARTQEDAAPAGSKRKPPIVQSAARGVRLLTLLARARVELRLAEISDQMGLPKVTTYRLLQTLVAERLVIQGPEPGCYRISPYATIGMMSCCPDARTMQAGISRLLTELAHRSGATALLLIPHLDVAHLGIVDHALPAQSLVVRPQPGDRLPLHAVSAGKCVLADFSPERLDAWLRAPLKPVTEATITDPRVLREQLIQVRAQGYATHREEMALGCWGMAAPVRDQAGQIVAALQFASPLAVVRMEEGLPRWLSLLQRGVEEMQQSLSPVLR